MQIVMRAGGSFPAAAIIENVRGEEILGAVELAGLVSAKKSFSVSIARGKGEVFMKFEGGRWWQSVVSVDKCFGIIKSKYREVRSA